MTLPRVFSWRSLRIAALSIVALVGLVVTGLALWGLPAPPALTVEQGPRVSWKWVWQGMRMVQRFQASRRFAGWLPGESGLLVHVGTPGAVHVVERSGATPARLAGLPDRASHVVQSRFTERPYFVFSLDEGGSERYIHYRFDLERGTYEPLTDRPARSYVGAFDGEGRHVIYASAKRNGTDVDLYVVDVTNPASETRVLEAGGDYAPGSLSPDGQSAFVNRYVSHSSSHVHLLDLDTRAMRPLFDGAPVGVADAKWGRDGRTLYLATDVDREFVGVHALDAASGETTLLTGDLDWDVEGVEELADGRMLALLVNEDARGTLYLLDIASGGLRKVGGAPAGHIERMVAHPRLALLALDVVSPMGVSGVWTYDVATGRTSASAAYNSCCRHELISTATWQQLDDRIDGPRAVPAEGPPAGGRHGGDRHLDFIQVRAAHERRYLAGRDPQVHDRPVADLRPPPRQSVGEIAVASEVLAPRLAPEGPGDCAAIDDHRRRMAAVRARAWRARGTAGDRPYELRGGVRNGHRARCTRPVD